MVQTTLLHSTTRQQLNSPVLLNTMNTYQDSTAGSTGTCPPSTHDMLSGLTENLAALVARRFATAKQAGALVFSQTEVTTISASNTTVSHCIPSGLKARLDPVESSLIIDAISVPT